MSDKVNSDLYERNAELEHEVQRLKNEINKLKLKCINYNCKIFELEGIIDNMEFVKDCITPEEEGLLKKNDFENRNI